MGNKKKNVSKTTKRNGRNEMKIYVKNFQQKKHTHTHDDDDICFDDFFMIIFFVCFFILIRKKTNEMIKQQTNFRL